METLTEQIIDDFIIKMQNRRRQRRRYRPDQREVRLNIRDNVNEPRVAKKKQDRDTAEEIYSQRLLRLQPLV